MTSKAQAIVVPGSGPGTFTIVRERLSISSQVLHIQAASPTEAMAIAMREKDWSTAREQVADRPGLRFVFDGAHADADAALSDPSVREHNIPFDLLLRAEGQDRLLHGMMNVLDHVLTAGSPDMKEIVAELRAAIGDTPSESASAAAIAAPAGASAPRKPASPGM